MSYTKTKSEFIILNDFLEFFNTHINHLTQISLINMTLKWHYINMFDRIDSFQPSNMVFGSFGCDYTL
jgi:hypothetical protein